MSAAGPVQTSDAALRTLEGSTSYLPRSIAQFFGSTETAEQWQNYEQLITACLRIGDEKSAHGILERLVARFGTKNEKVMALRGLFQEAVAGNRQALEKVLKEYDDVLEANPANIPVAKRRVTLLNSLSKPDQAIEALVDLLRISPTDAEAWCELSDLYLAQGMYAQAIHCGEEALLVFPNAWNLHAKLGEILYMAATVDNNSGKAEKETTLVKAIQRFSRSIELCDGYLRGYYGLSLATKKYIAALAGSKSTNSSANALSLNEADSLQKKAAAELRNIVNDKEASYDPAEVAAAEKLLTKAT